MEQWKRLEKYDEYEVSTEGKVRNIRTGRVLKTNVDKKGYEQVCLRKDNRTTTTRVHKLVGDAFLENDGIRTNVVHKNDIRNDNRLENLERMTRSQIDRRAFERGTRTSPRRVRVRVVENRHDGSRVVIGEFNSIRECAKFLGVTESVVSKCSDGLIKTCHGYFIERY